MRLRAHLKNFLELSSVLMQKSTDLPSVVYASSHISRNRAHLLRNIAPCSLLRSYFPLNEVWSYTSGDGVDVSNN